MKRYDLAVVGAGIVGLAHALAAARLGLSVVVVDRDHQANGASVRNFGFVTVTGQQRGECWHRARRSRDVWADLAPRAGIAVVHRGLSVVARRPEATAVLEAFLATEMGEGCTLHTPAAARNAYPVFAPEACAGVLWSPHDLRVESREAIPLLATYLAASLGVTVLRGTAVTALTENGLATSAGPIHAARTIVCPGEDFLTLLPERIERYALVKCKLQMLRAELPGSTLLPGAVMTDLSLARYLGYAELPAAAPLLARLKREQAAHLANGVHLIVVQSADGSLVVGDSHHYGATPDPFGSHAVDELILDEFRAVFGRSPVVTERWTGIYASAADRLMLVDAPDPRTRVVIVTSGTGASTSFAIAEEVVRDLVGEDPAARKLPS